MRYFLAVNHEHVWKQKAEAHLFHLFDLRSFHKNRKLYTPNFNNVVVEKWKKEKAK